MSKWYDSPAEAAKRQFLTNLKEFFEANPGWNKSRLLKAAGKDAALISRVESGEGFNVGSLEELQVTMDAIVDGTIKLKPRKPHPRVRNKNGDGR
jgi:hypothetical protein